jgi:hypothetical protein
MSLARLFKAGTMSASVPVAAATVDFANQTVPGVETPGQDQKSLRDRRGGRI